MGTLTPEQMLQQQQILRQQKMAEMLVQQGMQQPQGQMVSGRYVAPSFTQNLAGLANVYFGQRGLDKANLAQIDLAKQLRADESSAMADFLQQKQGRPAEMYPAQAGPMPTGGNIPLQESTPAVAPNPQAAYANLYANPKSSAAQRNLAFTKMNADPEEFTISEGQKRFVKMPDGTIKEVASGGEKLHTVNGNLVDSKGNLIYKAPKEYAPHANQLVSTDQGMVYYNPNTQTATPAMMNGKPIMPPMDSGAKTDLRDISKQQTIVAGALDAVKKTPTAFGFRRGASGAVLGESLSNRLETPAETEARSYVFNIVSKVIHDRAGASQTPSEIAKINRFLPNELDNAEAIQRKLKGFQTFLADEAKGVRTPFNAQTGENPAPPVLDSNRKIEKTGTVQDGPNKGKKAIQYSDGTIEYK